MMVRMNSHTLILRVVVPSAFGQLLDYFPPANCRVETLQPGLRVTVPLRKKQVMAIVMEVGQHSQIAPHKIKQAINILDQEPLLTPAVIELYRWASQYYHYPLGELLFNTLPKIIRKGQTLESFQTLHWQITLTGIEALKSGLKRAPKQRQILERLQQYQLGVLHTELLECGFKKGDLNKLISHGWITVAEEKNSPQPVLIQLPKYELNDHQKSACEAIAQTSAFKTFLLEGVTGSGKTEVYLQCIAKQLKENKQALVLVPEIALTPQTVDRFKKRFNCPVALIHSALSDRERAKSWLLARHGEAGIVIGTRSAIFTPIKNLGIIIVDEEHDNSFKQQSGFRYHARDCAIIRARSENCPIILGTATPSLESLLNVKRQRYQVLTLPERAGDARLPKIRLIDVRNERLLGGLSQSLLQGLHTHLENNSQVLLFLNRRGFAPTLMCHECGWMVHCDRCDARMTVHLNLQHQPSHLFCHHCSAKKIPPRICSHCKRSELMPVGIGTEKLQQILTEQFPKYAILRFDRDNVRTRSGLQEMLDQIHHEQVPILIGTQMLAKGHHLPELSLVAIVDADGGLFSADFRATERMGQLLMQVAGRAGREDKPGEVLIQTKHPNHPIMQLILQHRYRPFAETILQERHEANLPPYSSLALLMAESSVPEQSLKFLNQVRAKFQPSSHSGVQFLGPVPAMMERKAGKFRAHLLIQAKQRVMLQKQLDQLLPELSSLAKKPRIRWILDVDPQEMI